MTRIFSFNLNVTNSNYCLETDFMFRVYVFLSRLLIYNFIYVYHCCRSDQGTHYTLTSQDTSLPHNLNLPNYTENELTEQGIQLHRYDTDNRSYFKLIPAANFSKYHFRYKNKMSGRMFLSMISLVLSISIRLAERKLALHYWIIRSFLD